MSKAVDRPVCPWASRNLKRSLVSSGGAEAGELAHRPELAAVHARVGAARERVLAGMRRGCRSYDQSLQILGRVERLDLHVGDRACTRAGGPPAVGYAVRSQSLLGLSHHPSTAAGACRAAARAAAVDQAAGDAQPILRHQHLHLAQGAERQRLHAEAVVLQHARHAVLLEEALDHMRLDLDRRRVARLPRHRRIIQLPLNAARALLEKGAHAFGAIAGAEGDREGLGFVAAGIVEVDIAAGVDGGLGLLQRDRRLGRQRGRQLLAPPAAARPAARRGRPGRAAGLRPHRSCRRCRSAAAPPRRRCGAPGAACRRSRE